MLQIKEEQVNKLLDYSELIETLRLAFQQYYQVPMRHHHDFSNPETGQDSTLLLMPAWQAGAFLGVKTVIVSPGNRQFQLPAIHGTYLLFNATTGQPLLQCDARTLTKKRTAAASALAADYLARRDSRSLLMIGTGALAPELIKAHATVRPIEQVFLWGRRPERARELAEELGQELDLEITSVKTIKENAPQVDIISTATLSAMPLLYGDWLSPGQHIDLVGSYKPNMREADDQTIRKSSVFVDTRAGATKESGDLLIPLKSGVLQEAEIKADLFQLTGEEKSGRQHQEEITLFKSVGHALEDLAAAQLLYQHLV